MDIPIQREIKLHIPQELVEWIENEVKADVPIFCQKVLCQLLYETRNKMNAIKLKAEVKNNAR